MIHGAGRKDGVPGSFVGRVVSGIMRPHLRFHGEPLEQVGVRELKETGSEILRRVREDGTIYEVTFHGRVMARIVPVHQSEQQLPDADLWAEWDRLAAEISARWPAGVSAVDAVNEQRREL
jgi:prevent-host-death family protein